MENLKGYKVAVLVTDGFEEPELTVPVDALRKANAQVDIISPKGGKIQAYRHHDRSILVESDRVLDEIQPGEYDAVLLPGGVINADALRTEIRAQNFVAALNDAGRPIAVICHGAWLLISADLVRDRTITSWPTLRDDLRNAGARWEDKEVVLDANWVSSRKPDDLPAFCRAMVSLFSRVGSIRRLAA